MFDHTHYVPILRWKKAERDALGYLFPHDRAQLTPLVELVPTKRFPVATSRTLREIGKDIARAWPPRRRFFVDFRLPIGVNAVTQPHPLMALATSAKGYGLRMTPVTGLSYDSEYQTAVRVVKDMLGEGVCIRVQLPQLLRESFKDSIRTLLSRLGLPPEQTDLIVDCGATNEPVASIARACSSIPCLAHWRTFTVASGAFPVDLQGLQKNDQHVLPRFDWSAWQQLLISQVTRRPAYSDYTVQHPVVHEPPEHPNASASIRYAAADKWIVMRGEGVLNKDGPGYWGFIGNARLLVDRAEFRGAGYSYGDSYIARMSRQGANPGNLTTWLCAAINAHLTVTAREIGRMTERIPRAVGSPILDVSEVAVQAEFE